MSFDTVLERIIELGLEGPTGTGWDGNTPFRCPAHDDNSPSASVKEGDDGRVLLHCHAGCDVNDIVDALGLKLGDLFSSDEPQVVAEYVYTNEHGDPLIKVERLEPGVDGKKKSFRQYHRANARWVIGLADTRRPLYNLPAVLAADKVWVVEGEKDADRLNAILPDAEAATTGLGGSGKWLNEWTETLRSKFVTVVADNDEPGVKHAKRIREELPHARILYPAQGKDTSDHLDAGLSLDHLLEKPPAKPVVARRTAVLTPADLKPPPEWSYEPLFYDRSLIWFFGPSGHGKSIALDWAMTDMSRRGQNVLLYDWEDAQLELSRLIAMGYNPDHVRLVNQKLEDPCDLSTDWFRDEIRADIVELEPRLVVFNTFTTMYRDVGGTDAWNEAVREVGGFLKPLVAETGAAVVVVDHQENAEAVHAHGGRSKKSWSDQYLRVTQDQDELYDGGGTYSFKVDSLKQSRRAIKPVKARVTGRLEEGTLRVEWNPWLPPVNVGASGLERAQAEPTDRTEADAPALDGNGSVEAPATTLGRLNALKEERAFELIKDELGATEVAQ